MMKSPLYLLDKYVYPALRRQLVLKLYSKGLGVSEISRRLKLSKSLVSRYIRGERGSLVDVSKYRDVVEELDKIAEGIINNDIDEYMVEIQLVKLALYMMKKRYLCIYHGKIDPEINPSKCNICIEAF